MSKRQRIAAEATNEAACSYFEAIISKGFSGKHHLRLTNKNYYPDRPNGFRCRKNSTAADSEVGTQRNDKVDDDLKELEDVVFKE